MLKPFGASWRTSLSGLIAVTTTVIATQPALITFLPIAIQSWVRGIVGLIAAISAAYFALNTKDKQVTGGTVQQTAEGDVAMGKSASVVDTLGAKSQWFDFKNDNNPT
jgi:hypothetical protein